MGDDIPPTQSHSGWEVLNNDRSSSGVSSDFEGPNPQDEDEVDELDSSRYRQNHASRIGDTNQAIVDALNEAATLHGNTPIKVKRNVDVVAGGSADRPVKRQKTLEGRIVLKSRPSQVAEAVQDPPTSSDEAEAPQYGVQKKSVLLRTLTEKMPTARKSGFGPPPQKPRHSMPSLPTVHTIDLGNARGSGSVGSSSVTTQSAVNKPSRVGSSSPSSSSDAESNDEPPIVWSKRKARKTTGGLHPKKIFASVMGNANRKNAKSSSSSSSPTTTTSVSRPFAHGPATSASTMQKEAQPQRSQPQSEQPEEPSKVIDVIEISSDSDEPTAPPLPSRTKNKNIIFNSGTISKPFAKPAASISAKPSAFASTSSAPIKTTSTASTSRGG
ncbi:hypothetical protein FA15DRAFT_411065 [Coprinopsis marcescibilis]|uniref:Uncharacterized protein n=1 Tax=Coprinopsis marcescibilis TaxID=230819 RepID=A0A5C3KW45_COPMA|nr:hypothetical protein FA15DRAFT_411065 [Coprinopsis marcescibilis]